MTQAYKASGRLENHHRYCSSVQSSNKWCKKPIQIVIFLLFFNRLLLKRLVIFRFIEKVSIVLTDDFVVNNVNVKYFVIVTQINKK